MSEPTHRSRETPEGPAIVALGGGHGLFATLQAVRRLTFDVTAVVTVADDGGSSGRLRAELGVIPPGDLRMALAALASDEPEIVDWTRTIQHRFGGVGALAGHSVGNLILAGLTEVLGDPVVALDEMRDCCESVAVCCRCRRSRSRSKPTFRDSKRTPASAAAFVDRLPSRPPRARFGV